MEKKKKNKKDEKVETHREIELQELGNTLPLIRTGPDNKPLDKQTFSFLAWDMPAEEKISEHKSKNKTVGGLVSKILIELLDEFCGQDFHGLSDDKKILMINQMEFSNVLYMYIYLRVEELGHELKLPVDCPTCKHSMPDFVADLRTFEIHVKDAKHAVDMEYVLKKPIMASKDVMVTAFKLVHSKWDALENATLDVANNEGLMKKLLIKTSVGGLVGEEGEIKAVVSVDDVINKLGKGDIEGVSKAIQKHNAGPLMALEGDCDVCNKRWFKLLDWTYDFFFGSSSL